MFEMIRGELTKLRKRKMTWILLAVMVVYYGLIFFAIYSIANNPPHRMEEQVVAQIKASIQFPGAFDTIFSSAGDIGVLLLIILVASSIGNEYGWGSIRQVLLRRGIRSQFVLSKVISFVIVAIIGLVLAVLTGFIITIITSNLLGTIDWGFLTGSFALEQLEAYGWTLFALLPFIMLATFFAFWGRSAITGIGGALGFYIIEAIVVGIFSQSEGWLGEVPPYLIGPNVDALIPASMFDQMPFAGGVEDITTLHAAITLSVYCVVLLVASLVMFKKRDIVV